MSETPQGVIFDLDGVLVDTEPIHAEAWQVLLAEFGVELTREWLRDWVGIPDRDLAMHLTQNQRLSVSGEDLLARKRYAFREFISARIRPDESLIARIEALRAADMGMAVATSSHWDDVKHTLTCAGLLERFAAIVSAEDVRNHKPAPDPFLLAAERVQLSASGCVAIEDSPAGVRAARDAGCTVLGVTSTYAAEALEGVDCVFERTTEAVDWVLDRVPGTQDTA